MTRAETVSGREAKTASCFFRNSLESSGEATTMTWTPPRRMHAISVSSSCMSLCIHRNVGLFESICGRLPTKGKAVGPGGIGGRAASDIFLMDFSLKKISETKHNVRTDVN